MYPSKSKLETQFLGPGDNYPEYTGICLGYYKNSVLTFTGNQKGPKREIPEYILNWFCTVKKALWSKEMLDTWQSFHLPVRFVPFLIRILLRKTVKCLMEQMQVLTHLLKYGLELMRAAPPLGKGALACIFEQKRTFHY